MAVETKKKEVIDKFQGHEKDTGSSAVQIALLTTRINKLVGHLKINKNDFHSMRGLLMLVGKRRRLMKYYKDQDFDKFKELISKLDLKDKL